MCTACGVTEVETSISEKRSTVLWEGLHGQTSFLLLALEQNCRVWTSDLRQTLLGSGIAWSEGSNQDDHGILFGSRWWLKAMSWRKVLFSRRFSNFSLLECCDKDVGQEGVFNMISVFEYCCFHAHNPRWLKASVFFFLEVKKGKSLLQNLSMFKIKIRQLKCILWLDLWASLNLNSPSLCHFICLLPCV